MNAKFLIKISNIIGLVSILLLIYWVFTFVLVQVFGLKVFREYITNTFGMSILGIIALMAGALMLNIMFNLTRIAERGDEVKANPKIKRIIYALLAVFPLIAALCFGGDFLTSQKKQNIFVNSAENIIQTQPNRLTQLLNYHFDANYIKQSSENLQFLGVLDKSFNQVKIIVPDEIQANPVYLEFGENYFIESESNENEVKPTTNAALPAAQAIETSAQKTKISLDKKRYVATLNLEEKEYLDQVFKKGSKQIRFRAKDGFYELYYPYHTKNKTIVLYFSDRQYYGKLGS